MAKYASKGREAVYNLDTYIDWRIIGNSRRSLICVGGPEESSYHNYSKVVSPRKSHKVEVETMVATPLFELGTSRVHPPAASVCSNSSIVRS